MGILIARNIDQPGGGRERVALGIHKPSISCYCSSHVNGRGRVLAGLWAFPTVLMCMCGVSDITGCTLKSELSQTGSSPGWSGGGSDMAKGFIVNNDLMS